MPKHVFVTGGVVSGLGKGVTAASIGRLLKDRGLSVAPMKFDPYLNVDPGTMKPISTRGMLRYRRRRRDRSGLGALRAFSSTPTSHDTPMSPPGKCIRRS